MSTNTLQLQLFGPGRAQFADRPLVGFPNQQAYHLFCYLILNRQQPHHRERLAAVFWSEYPTAISRKYLRDALWRLRQNLQAVGALYDAYLRVDDVSVSFDNSAAYWLDIEEFERTVKRFEDLRGGDLSADASAQLEHAVDLYVGELLEGAYQDWCIRDRERLNMLYVNALGKLIAYHEANGSYERGITFGERILQHDITRERVHRQLMRLHWLCGNRSAALAQYKRCVQVMREMLDVAPMEETRLLYEQMLHDEFNPAPRVAGSKANAARLNRGEGKDLTIDRALQKLRRLHVIPSASGSSANYGTARRSSEGCSRPVSNQSR